MASITFTGESAESFANFLQYIKGFTVEVVPDDSSTALEPFDAVVIGSASDTTGDYYGVRVLSYDDAAGGPVGEPFDVIVSELRVY
jgi:hypothetical protein